MPLTQANRQVSVTSALDEDALLFHRMSGREELGRMFEYRVQMLSASNAVRIAEVLGKPLTVHLALADGSKRHFNGIVTRFCSAGWSGSFCTYEATVHPWLWLLTRSSDCRIFQDLSVVDIVKQVCANAAYGGLVELDTAALSGTYEALPYCVQYRETDFDFVCRLLEGAGIYFYFTHEESKHTMVLADSYGAHAAVVGYETVRFEGENGRSIADFEAMFGWRAGGEIVSGGYTLNDFDFEKAAASTSRLRTVDLRALRLSRPVHGKRHWQRAGTLAHGNAAWPVRTDPGRDQCPWPVPWGAVQPLGPSTRRPEPRVPRHRRRIRDPRGRLWRRCVVADDEL
jgi:type VI secretion system secreted protein VgrG